MAGPLELFKKMRKIICEKSTNYLHRYGGNQWYHEIRNLVHCSFLWIMTLTVMHLYKIHIFLSIHLSVYLFIYPSIHLSLSASISLSIYLSIHPAINLCIFFIYLSRLGLADAVLILVHRNDLSCACAVNKEYCARYAFKHNDKLFKNHKLSH